jgi:hypothetical protein
MTNGNWVSCFFLSLIAGMSLAFTQSDITQMIMIMNRPDVERGPFGFFMEVLLAFKWQAMQMIGVFANVHHVAAGNHAMLEFGMRIVWIHNFSRLLYILLPESIRVTAEGASPPIEATEAEISGLNTISYIYVPYVRLAWCLVCAMR